jgi:hypothetical protein
MGRKSFWLSRTAGGAVAGVLMAGAGVGIAVAGTAGSSDQYTPGAKPYAGVAPHDVTVGTHTYPSTVTTNITNTTVTQPYAVTVPYTTTSTTAEAALAAEVEAEALELGSDSTVITTFLKDDLRKLLEPTGNYLKITTLAKAKSIGFAFVSPGSGKLNILWKFGVPGKNGNKGVYYVNYGGRLSKLGDITVHMPTTAAGRRLLTGARKGNAQATVTYTSSAGVSVKVVRSYKLVG